MSQKRLYHPGGTARSALIYNKVTGTLLDSVPESLDKTNDNFDDLYARIVPTGSSGWRDMVGQIVPAPLGPANPAWTQMGSSPFYGYLFAANDHIQICYHFNHDLYIPATGNPEVYLHAHWTTNGTSTNSVTWQMTWVYAKGYDQGNFDIAGGGTAVVVTQAAAGTAWRHMIAEIAVPISSEDFEVDGLILCQYKRIANPESSPTLAANADGVFLLTADGHHLADRLNTAEKNFPFY